MTVDRSAVFPLHISCNFLLHTPPVAAADANAAAADATSNQ